MNKKDIDRLLHIKTGNSWERLDQSIHYNQYEATPYTILQALFHAYELKATDRFVDFGCGKGRILFYIHNRFQVSVTGIEMNEQLYQKALKNQKNYMRKVTNNSGVISIECCLAEEYEVKATENRFYFFNPFSVEIFTKIIDNILFSISQLEREIDVILYYPTPEYTEYLEADTAFKLVQEVKVPGLYEINKNERFLIYRIGG